MKVILNAGIYDLCHRGHLALLRRMREAGDALIVVLHDDASTYRIKGKIPIQALEHRHRNLEITGLVGKIKRIYTEDPADAFEELVLAERGAGNEVVYMRGDDLVDGFPGQWKLEELNVPIVFLPYTKGVSSTDLRKELETL